MFCIYKDFYFQGLVGAIFEGAGVSLGSFVGGLIYEKYGGPWTFRLFGIGSLIACLFHFFVQLLLQRRSKTTSGGSDQSSKT